jgi:CRISPR-associated exonuclease Cas4
MHRPALLSKRGYRKPMYSIDDMLSLFTLRHIVLCERQCALIDTEQVCTGNRLTVEGKVIHQCVYDESRESQCDVRIDYGVSLRSLRLGMIGKADDVESHRRLDGAERSFPVEHKQGNPKVDDCDIVKTCARAIRLAEMLSVTIPEGRRLKPRMTGLSQARRRVAPSAGAWIET